MQKKGNKYGVHRVIEPKGLMTQAAKKIDNTMECYSNEILCDVSALNIDSASFTQIYEACGKDLGTKTYPMYAAYLYFAGDTYEGVWNEDIQSIVSSLSVSSH